MLKLGKDDARDIAGVHVSIVQPFALLDAIELAELTAGLPHFLPDSDSLTREVQQLWVRRSAAFVSIDIRRLYPTIDLHRCLAAARSYQLAQLPEGAPTAAIELAADPEFEK